MHSIAACQRTSPRSTRSSTPSAARATAPPRCNCPCLSSTLSSACYRPCVPCRSSVGVETRTRPGACWLSPSHEIRAYRGEVLRRYSEGCSEGLPLATNEVTVSAVLCAFARDAQRDTAAERALAFFLEVESQWPRALPPVCYLLLRDVAAAAGDVAVAQTVQTMMRSMRARADDGEVSVTLTVHCCQLQFHATEMPC